MHFDNEQIKVNESALEEMVQMRQESVLSWQNPLKSFSCTSICYLNKGAWNAHLEHFLSGNIFKVIPAYSVSLKLTLGIGQ